MTGAILLPHPPAKSRSSPGIAQSIGLLVVFYFLIVAASLVIAPIQSLAKMKLDLFSSLVIMQAFAWPLTIGLGLQWARVPFREACPLVAFPARIVPSLLVAFFGLAILSIAVATMIPMPESIRERLTRSTEGGAWSGMLLAAVVFAPVAEELFFRGLLLRGFLGRYSRTKAVWASSVIFALFHMNPWQAAVALPTGLALAWLFLRTGSLIPCILGHATINISASYLLAPLGRGLGYDSEAMKALEYFPPSMLAIGLTSALIGWAMLQRQLAGSPPKPGLPAEENSNPGEISTTSAP